MDESHLRSGLGEGVSFHNGREQKHSIVFHLQLKIRSLTYELIKQAACLVSFTQMSCDQVFLAESNSLKLRTRGSAAL
jgi:hypothetical protein